MNKIPILALLVLLLSSLAVSVLDEFSGVVTGMSGGGTIEVQGPGKARFCRR